MSLVHYLTYCTLLDILKNYHRSLKLFRFRVFLKSDGGVMKNNGRLAIHMIILFFAIIVLFNLNSAYGAVSSDEKHALEVFYNSTDGPGWTTSTNWLNGDPCENSWHGVQCNTLNSKVETLDLGNNNLTGSIPPEIGDLVNLKFLELSGNDISGSIPVEPQMRCPWRAIFYGAR